jgi:urocanate hydratase
MSVRSTPKLERALSNDRAMGVLRHVDAGYPEARQVATERSISIPMDERP